MNETLNTMNTSVNQRIPLQNQTWFKISVFLLYSVIALLGIAGNGIVCFILYRRKSLRTVTNLFIFNLAISDLIFSGSIPLEFPIILNNYEWPYAAFFCKLYAPIQTTALSASIFTLTTVSLIRYRAIKHPLKRQVSLYHGNYILAGIWLVSTLLLLPHVLTLKHEENQCGEEWSDLRFRKMYTVFLFVALFVIPLCVIVFTCTSIVRELMTKKHGQNSALNEIWDKEAATVVRMFLKVTLVFAVCNLPSQLMWLWLDFGNADKTFAYFFDLLAALNILIYANSAANPFIYYICHDKFRAEAVSFLSSFSRCSKLRMRTRGFRTQERRNLMFNLSRRENGNDNAETDNKKHRQFHLKIIDKTDETFK